MLWNSQPLLRAAAVGACCLLAHGANAQGLVSSNPQGQAVPGGVRAFSVSTDGRYVAFCFGPAPLLPEDTNGRLDFYLKDRLTETVALVSIRPDGSQFQNADCARSAVSDDGRYVAFEMADLDLALTGAYFDGRRVFRRDVLTGTTVLVSRAVSGAEITWDARLGDMTPDGRYVVLDIEEPAGGRQAGDNYGILLRDVVAATSSQIATVPVGNGAFPIGQASVSRDGGRVAFATNWPLLPDHTSASVSQAYVFDRVSATLSLGSRNGDGAPADRSVSLCRISRNGRYLLFSTTATAFGLPVNPVSRIFRRDLQTGAVTLVTETTGGMPASGVIQGYQDFYDCDITDDGSAVSFLAQSTLGETLAELLGPTIESLYVRGVPAGAPALAVVTPGGANPGRLAARLAGDGQSVVFATDNPEFVGPLPGNPAGAYVFATATPAPVDLRVAVIETARETPPSGGPLRVTLAATITNQSGRDARLAGLVLDLPTDYRLISFGTECQGTGDSRPPVRCRYGRIPAGGSVVATIQVAVTSALPALGTAQVSQADPDPDPADNAVEFTIAAQSPGGGGSGGGGGADVGLVGLLSFLAALRRRVGPR